MAERMNPDESASRDEGANPDERMDPATARAALDAGVGSAGRLRARARWTSTKLAVFGVGFGAFAAAVGMTESRAIGLVIVVGWAALVAAMVLWERRRPAHLPGTDARISPYWMGTIVLYAIAIAVGTGESADELTFWLPAGVLVALPMLVGAVRERRA